MLFSQLFMDDLNQSIELIDLKRTSTNRSKEGDNTETETAESALTWPSPWPGPGVVSRSPSLSPGLSVARVGGGQTERAPPPQAVVKPHVLTHLIEGFVIQEGAEPFPVSIYGIGSSSQSKTFERILCFLFELLFLQVKSHWDQVLFHKGTVPVVQIFLIPMLGVSFWFWAYYVQSQSC